MRADPRALVKHLDPTAKRHLERAVSRAVESQHIEIVPEHVLASILEESSGDVAVLLTAEERAAAARDVGRSLSRVRCGAARPVLGDVLVRWLEDAWMLASIGWGESSIRTGALLVQSITDRTRYFADAAAMFEGVSTSDAREKLASSTEESESRASDASRGRASSESPALARFTTSFTQLARDGKLDPVLGRDREIRAMIDILARRRKNNPILVGEPGVGKTALVEGMALAIARGEVPEPLRGVEVLALDLGLLEAGASVKGELESRLTSVIREVKESVTPIVLFIDEAHTLVGGAQKGGVDVANLLKPALARGELRTIAATTWAEYKKYFEKDAALERRFQPVKVEEPSEDDAIAMLRGLRTTYEKAHGVIVRDEAIEAAVRLSKRFLAGRQLPDKCVDLLDTAAARVRVSQSAPPMALVRIDSQLAALERHRDALARDRLDTASPSEPQRAIEEQIAQLRGERAELEARLAKQRAALEHFLGARRALAEAEDAASERSRRDHEIEVRAARDAFTQAVGDEPLVSAEVDASVIATTIESWTGIPVGALKSNQTDTLLRLESELDRRVLGQPQASKRIAEALRVAHAGMRRSETPRGVFLLVGPSGVGKTETAHALADLLFGGERALTTINLSEYQEKHTVSRLVGSPPGYVGYGEGGKLTEAVRQRPHSVVLLDECEKADREVMNVFYQLFDRGTLADGEGRLIDFKNTLVLLTSNLASDRVAKLAASGVTDLAALEEAIRPTLSQHFAPALLARMTVVPYLPISEVTLRAIARGELARVEARLEAAHGAKLTFGDRIGEMLVARCTESEAGVRYLRTMLERHVLAPLATEILGARAEGRAVSRASVDLADDGALTLQWGAS